LVSFLFLLPFLFLKSFRFIGKRIFFWL
jgi:hypothetical protein